MGRGFQPTRPEVTAKNHHPWGEDEDRTTRWTLPFWLGEGEQFLRSEEGGSRPPALPLEMRRPRRGPTAGVRAHIPWQGRGGDQEPPIFQGIDQVDRRHEQAGGANLEDLASSQDGQPAGETGRLRLEMPAAGGAAAAGRPALTIWNGVVLLIEHPGDRAKDVGKCPNQVDERQRVRQRIQGWAGEVDSVNPVGDSAVEQRPRNGARAPQ